MRNLPLLLVLLLLSALLAGASVQASPLPSAPQPTPTLLAEAEEEDEGEEAEEAEDPAEEAEIEREICEEDPELCEEEDEGQGKGKGKKADECLLKKASATVTANPGKRRLRLTVHYKTLKPATVNVETLLRSSKGVVYLGNEHARFRRSGVYRDSYELAEKQMKKAATAREFEVELHVVNTPPACAVELSAHRKGAKKLSWS